MVQGELEPVGEKILEHHIDLLLGAAGRDRGYDVDTARCPASQGL